MPPPTTPPNGPPDAVRYVIDAPTGELDFRWEGTAVLVAETQGAVKAAALAIVDEGRRAG